MVDEKGDEMANIREAVENVEIDQVTQISFLDFDKQGNKTTKLLPDSGEQSPLDSKNRWFEFTLKEPVFAFVMRVSVQGFEDYHKFDVEWLDVQKRKHVGVVRPNGDYIDILVNAYVCQIRFRPPSSYFSRRKILEVKLWGSKPEGLRNVLQKLHTLEEQKQRALQIVTDLKNSRDDLAVEISALNSQLAAVQSNLSECESAEAQTRNTVAELEVRREAIQNEITNLETREESARDRFKKVDEEVAKKAGERKAISEEIAEKGAELRNLKENINMFPTTLEGFASESAATIERYFKLAFIPVAIIAIMFGLLVYGAADLSTIYRTDEPFDIWAITVTRIPYVVIATVIVAASYKIARVFIEEMMRIGNQKLNLNKVNIIASDVADVAEQGLGLSAEQAYELRTQFKMSLLRDHLKTYVTADYAKRLPPELGLSVFRNPLGRTEGLDDLKVANPADFSPAEQNSGDADYDGEGAHEQSA